METHLIFYQNGQNEGARGPELILPSLASLSGYYEAVHVPEPALAVRPGFGIHKLDTLSVKDGKE